MFAFFASLALRFPFVAKILQWTWTYLLGAMVVAGMLWAFISWRDNLKEEAFASGRESAEQEFALAVSEANERERETQGRLDQMVVAFGSLAQVREQEVNLSVKPIIERIESEVASDVRYRDCFVSDGMLNNINTGRASIDASVAATNPKSD